MVVLGVVIVGSDNVDGEFLVAVELLVEIEVERGSEAAYLSFLASFSVLPQRVVVCLYLVVGAPELCEDVWRELCLECQVVVLIIYILEVEVLGAVAEVVVATVEIVGYGGSIGEHIRVFALAVGVVAILHAVVEGYLVVAFVVAHEEVGVVECHPGCLHHVEACGITGVKGLGLDVDECAYIGIACRWNGVVFHILDFVYWYGLEVVVGGFHAVYEYLQRLAGHGVELSRECVEAEAWKGGEYFLCLSCVLLLFVGEGEDGAVYLVHSVMSLHHHAVDGILVALHVYCSGIADGDSALYGLESDASDAHEGLAQVARNDKLAVFVAHASGYECRVFKREKLDVGKHYRSLVFIDELPREPSLAFVDTLHRDKAVANVHGYWVKAYHVA